MNKDTCQNCRFFKPMFFHIGRCQRQVEGTNSKMFTDDGKAGILVHITFGCNQHEDVPETDKEML